MSAEIPERNKPASKPITESAFATWLPRLRALYEEWTALPPQDKLTGALRGIGVLILAAIPVFLFAYQGEAVQPDPQHYPRSLAIDWTGGRVIWTVIIALLPLFIVSIGFYNWRKICPLAFFGRLSEWIEWPDSRKTPNTKLRRKRVPKWISVNYPLLTWGFLTAMLAARILLTNSNAVALAAMFAGMCLLAAVCSFRYTGKAWCNFFCPVGAIERIYTDGDRPNYRHNSQCPKCTGCKTVPSGGLCPDINQENDYWQELKYPARAWAYYAWPGVVFGFYLWYFLHKPYYWHDFNRQGVLFMRGHSIAVPFPYDGGTDWGYYLSGDWTRDPMPWQEWLTPGLGFHHLPPILAHLPTLIAAPLLLIVCSLLSFGLFFGLEKAWRFWMKRRGIEPERAQETARHSLFSIAGFTAFLCFYQFAGAPTFRLLPFGMYATFQFSVTVFATTVLITRLRRTRTRQLQYDQARKWLLRWPLPNVPPPSDLEESYRVVTEHLRSSEDRARLFENTLRGMMADNLITATEISLLDRMAQDLGLNESDKKKIVKQLGSQYPGLFTGSLNDGLRLIGYRSELERALSDNRGALPNPASLRGMQARYRIQPEEHEEALNELRNPNGARAENLRKEVEELQVLRRDIALLEVYPTAAIRFLLHELSQQARDERDHILEVANLYGAAGELTGFIPAIRQGDRAMAIQAANWIRRHLPDTIAEQVAQAACLPDAPTIAFTGPPVLARTLLRWSQEGDLTMRAAAIYAMSSARAADPATREAARARAESHLTDAEPLLREAAIAALAPYLSIEQWKAALRDSSVSVRRSAIHRLPWPASAEVTTLARAAREDPDVQVRAKADSLCEDREPILPGGQPLPNLTTLEKMFELRAVQLLAHLPSHALHELAERTEEQLFLRGQALCIQGERGDDVYLIIEGRTEAIQQRGSQEYLLGINNPGECVGEMAILDPGPRIATVRAVDNRVRTLTVHGEIFRSLLNRDATTSMSVIRLLIHRQRQAAQTNS